MVGGREDLLPRLVHYGGHQPPTPPSPAPHKALGLGVSQPGSESSSRHAAPGSRRRDRDEYEKDNGSPPLGRGPGQRRAQAGPFDGRMRDSPETTAAKKERFMKLVEEAWDLFHS